MKYYLIAGEASGDLHGANLMKGILKCDPEAEFRFWGGDRMAEVGGVERLAKHYRHTSFFGVSEVLKNLRTIFSQLDECQRDVEAFAPDVLICIDYPGFNFKMAKFAHRRGIPVFYYISPKVWAWKERRVELIRKYVTRLYIIFSFEVEYFRERGIEAVYEGNPIMDPIAERLAATPSREEFMRAHGLDGRPIVALLAGSRKSEIRRNLNFMKALAASREEYQFVVAGVSWIAPELYDSFLAGSGVKVLTDRTYELLKHSAAAVVCSGTATLETALIGTPEVVCYRMDEFSYRVAKVFVKIGFISLVNIIMGREVVKELIQHDMTVELASAELSRIVEGGSGHERMMADYGELARIVGGAGASERFARRMVEELKTIKKL
ncbi:MAG: lipid-A-disaccharide synthase [Tidjanibacter sp.]|nr:lipid-A-disaccharide synthase [Tidjanibacter sp.]